MNYELCITIRALEPEDADFMYEVESDEEAWRYSDYIAPMSREILRQYALTYDADPFRSGQLRLVIELDGIPAGLLDLFDISPRHLRADCGIYVLLACRRRGVAVEALRLLKDYCRTRLGLHQLTATVADSNEPALKTFEKAGFKVTGKRPDWIRNADSYESVCLLSSIL